MHLLQLPVDIIIAIISHLATAQDLHSCNQTCRAIHNLFKSSPQLYHKLSLARAGLVDTPYGIQTKSLHDRTRLVVELEQRWWPRCLLSRRQLKILLDSPCTDYQICNGIIVAGILSPTGDSLHELQVYRLPSYLTDLKSKLWRHKVQEDKYIRQLKVDPSQDLLVLVGVGPPDFGHFDSSTKYSINLHLRTLSTNDHHPAASLATLSLDGVLSTQPFVHPNSRGRVAVRICEDILGILTNPDSTDPATENTFQTLVIWQWTSGQQIMVLSSLDNVIINDLAFVGRHTMLLTHSITPTGPGINVLHLASGQLYARTPDATIPLLDSLETSVFFQLPSPPSCSRECLKMGSIKIIGEPPAGAFQLMPEDNNRAPRVFTPDPSEMARIIAFSLPIQVMGFGSTQTNTINHTLLTRASVFSIPYSPKHFYTFNEWNFQGTHWFSGEPGFIHGQRYALASSQYPRTKVDIYDFNPCHVESPSPGWLLLFKEGNSKFSPDVVPKISPYKTKCGHKRYLNSELRSTMRHRRQSMKAGLARQQDRVISALDSESVITIELERGGLVRGFVAYNL